MDNSVFNYRSLSALSAYHTGLIAPMKIRTEAPGNLRLYSGSPTRSEKEQVSISSFYYKERVSRRGMASDSHSFQIFVLCLSAYSAQQLSQRCPYSLFQNQLVQERPLLRSFQLVLTTVNCVCGGMGWFLESIFFAPHLTLSLLPPFTKLDSPCFRQHNLATDLPSYSDVCQQIQGCF